MNVSSFDISITPEKPLYNIWFMKDELTTEMHWEFMADEMSREDFLVMAVVGAMNRGATKSEALKKYGLSEEYYDENYERVMGF